MKGMAETVVSRERHLEGQEMGTWSGRQVIPPAWC